MSPTSYLTAPPRGVAATLPTPLGQSQPALPPVRMEPSAPWPTVAVPDLRWSASVRGSGRYDVAAARGGFRGSVTALRLTEKGYLGAVVEAAP
jgi:hypothetical protein